MPKNKTKNKQICPQAQLTTVNNDDDDWRTSSGSLWMKEKTKWKKRKTNGGFHNNTSHVLNVFFLFCFDLYNFFSFSFCFVHHYSQLLLFVWISFISFHFFTQLIIQKRNKTKRTNERWTNETIHLHIWPIFFSNFFFALFVWLFVCLILVFYNHKDSNHHQHQQH